MINLAEVPIKDLPRQSSVLSDGDLIVLDTGAVTYAISILNFISNYLASALDIPTKTSDLQNDSGFLTAHQQVDASLSPSSTNPIQNSAVSNALTALQNSLPSIISTQLGTNVLRNISFSVSDGVMTVTKTFYNGTTETSTVTLFTDGDDVPV